MTKSETRGAKRGRRARAVDRATQRFLGVRGRDSGYRIVQDIEVPTRDGFQLLTDHYIPERAPSGTILVRSPYGKGFPVSLFNGRIFAAAGYHVLIQNVRGRFGSTGTFQPFVHEQQDAQDTVTWMRSQSWFNGRLATLGGSYMGFAQWALLADPPPELQASVIVVGPHDMSEAMYGTGAFALGSWLAWSEGAAEQAELSFARGMTRLMTADRRIKPALDGLPLAEAADPLLDGRAPWYREWLLHPDRSDRYWDVARHTRALRESEVPTLLITGWHDAFIDQTLEQYSALQGRKVDVALTVGPWSHMDTAVKASAVITAESLDWLDHHLGARSKRRTSPVRVFVVGLDQWRDYPEWPPPSDERQFFLDDEGALSESAGSGSSSFVYDPADPTPALGGRVMSPRHAGAKDNKKLEQRNDVVTFTGKPLENDVEILGRPMMSLTISVDNPHADVFVRLCDVDGRGRSFNVADAMLRLDPGGPPDEEQHVTLELDPCAYLLRAGHRLRLQVSGGAHPRFARNLGTDEPVASGRTLAPSKHVVHHGTSRITLPVSAG
jgi:putative CocE/NonD family hydrolase